MKLKRINDARRIALLNEPVQKLHHEMYPSYYKAFNLNEVENFFLSLVDNETHHFIICEDQNTELGYIWFQEIKREETAFSYGEHSVYIHHLSVNEGHQGKGIGKMLFNYAREYANERNIKKIELDYVVKNTNAKTVYKKLGFEVNKEIAVLHLS